MSRESALRIGCRRVRAAGIFSCGPYFLFMLRRVVI
nr:MAG TPA: hypothetical protein [Caudoviricetes sp.]